MPELQGVGCGVANRADAELQRAAVPDQARDMQASGMIGSGDRPLWRAEQPAMSRLAFEHVIEDRGFDFSFARHVGEVAVDLGHERHRRAGDAALLEWLQQIERHVRIAAQAEACPALPRALGDQLAHHIHAMIQKVARRMRVIGADIILLRRWQTEQSRRLQEELVNLDVGRQRALAAGARVGELRTAAEQALVDRPEEAALELARGIGFSRVSAVTMVSTRDGSPAARR